MQRNAGLVADGGQQLELGLAELTRHLAVDVQHAENGVSGSHRRAHHRADPLPDDAFAAHVAIVGQRIVGEDGDALFEHVVDHRPRQHHLAGGVAVLGAHGHHVDVFRIPFSRPHDDGSAIAAAHLEDGRDNRIEQRFHAAGAGEDFRHLVQRGQVFLRRLQQVRLVLALIDLREELELGRVDRARHDRLAARLDEAQ
jgi:hypothetical protein